ncbi:MAG: hypothetical protein ACI92W_000264, partial [Paraglaciecola sp.]
LKIDRMFVRSKHHVNINVNDKDKILALNIFADLKS